MNVSPDSITDPDWWSALGAQLRAKPGVAQRMIIEITETAAIQNIDETAGFVTRAKDLGCRIAIDDFGAGYTSFRNLRRLGVDIIKIDGAFVQNLPRSEDDRAFVRTLIDLGRSLGLKTVAEWVQNEDAAAVLTEWGCDYLQGDLIGRASLDKPWAPDAGGDVTASSPVRRSDCLTCRRSSRSIFFCISESWRRNSSRSLPAAAAASRPRPSLPLRHAARTA